jgi:hypothetical protein
LLEPDAVQAARPVLRGLGRNNAPELPDRCAKDTGLTNLPLHDFDQNQIWCALIALACEITAWMQTLALHGHPARRWEPKRLRIRLFTVPATLARTARQRLLHLAEHHPWAATVANAAARLRALTAAPKQPRLTPPSPVPTTPNDPDRGTGGHPSDIRPTVIPRAIA